MPGARCGNGTNCREKLSPRYADYARACASLGINGAVINNVNADPQILATGNMQKVAALAGVWRPYGVRMYLSANFAAPVRVGGLATADPLDKGVPIGGRPRRTKFTRSFPTSAVSSSRQTPKVNPDRKRMAALTPTGRTCWPTRSLRTRAASCGARLFTMTTLTRIAPSALTSNSCGWTGNLPQRCGAGEERPG